MVSHHGAVKAITTPPVEPAETIAVPKPVPVPVAVPAPVATLPEIVSLPASAVDSPAALASPSVVAAPAPTAQPFLAAPAMEMDQVPLLPETRVPLLPETQAEPIARPFLPDLAFPGTLVAPLEFTSSASLPVSSIALAMSAAPPVPPAPLPAAPASTPAAGPGNLQFAEIRMQSTSPEEISDVMQEAEFWLSLRDLERAADVLEPYATYEQAGSPLPWLYLFDVYRELGAREKYDSLRDRFQRIFNGKALTWEEQQLVLPDAPQRGVEDVPHVALKLTTLWQTEAILPYLEGLLIDDRDGTRAGFDIAVYKEIMFLILLAYELEQAKQYLKPALGTPGAPMLA